MENYQKNTLFFFSKTPPCLVLEAKDNMLIYLRQDVLGYITIDKDSFDNMVKLEGTGHHVASEVELSKFK